MSNRNRHPALCYRCGKTVATGDGVVSGKLGHGAKTWRVSHWSCIPVELPVAIAEELPVAIAEELPVAVPE